MRSDYLNENSSITYGFKYKVQPLLADISLTSDDSGKIFVLDIASGLTSTLPSVADAGAGWNCKFVVGTPPTTAYVITENTNADTNVIVTNGINELEVDTSNDGPYNSGHTTITFAENVAVKGDYVDVWCDGSNYYASGQTNTRGGVTLA